MQGAGPGVGPRHPHVSHCVTAVPQLALQAALLVGIEIDLPARPKLSTSNTKRVRKLIIKMNCERQGAKGRSWAPEEGTGRGQGRLGEG